MDKVIAVVKLAPGEVGFYDELTRTHLTIANPFAKIYEWMNTSAIQRALRFKRLVLIAGTLNPAVKTAIKEEEKLNIVSPKIEVTPVVETAPVAEEIAVTEKVIEEAAPVEEVTVVEETIEQPETTKKKSTRKKKEE